MVERRGFIILIVLVVLAILSAAVLAQFASTGSNQIIGVRSADDSKARALAEGCLTLLQEYAEAELGSPIPPSKDFDDLLNPDNAVGFSGTENMPLANAGETPVLLPKGTAGSASFLSRHRWLLIPRAVGTERGACMVRYDDNSDEALPTSQLPGTVADKLAPFNEGPLSTVEIPWLDRDRAIYLTAIGLFPFLPNTIADDAYGRAHARVTLRRLYNPGATAVAGSPAVWAGSVSGFKGPICGGGITTNTWAKSPLRGSGCACGPLIGTAAPPAAPQCSAAQCPGGCNAPSSVAAAFDAAGLTNALNAQTPPGAWGGAFNVLHNQSFTTPAPVGAALPAPADMNALDLAGGRASCKLYYEAGGSVYVWDRLDAIAPHSAGTEDCTVPMPVPLVPAPCDWSALPPTCAAGQSACWKRVNDGAVSTTFAPNKTPVANPIPFVSGGDKFWGATPGNPDYLCGDPAGCTGCDGVANGTVANNAGRWTGAAWSFDNTDNADMPTPAYAVVATTAVLVSPGWASSSPLRVSFSADGSVGVSSQSSVCGAACDCTSMGASAAIAACTPAGAGALVGQNCSAIRARDAYQTASPANNIYMIGSVRAGTVLDDTNAPTGCYVGSIAAMGASTGIDCLPPGGKCNPPEGYQFCWMGGSAVIGDQPGDAVFNPAVYVNSNGIISAPQRFWGVMAARLDMCAEPVNGAPNMAIVGNLIAGRKAWAKGSSPTTALVTFEGASAVSAIASLRTMMETAW